MDPVHARFGREELVLELDDRLKLRIDSLGRWLSYRDERGLYRRLISSSIVEQGERVRDATDASAIVARVREAVSTFQRALAEQCSIRVSGRDAPTDDAIARRDARAWLDRTQAWTDARYAEQAELFRRAYPDPVPILPPDRARDLVVLPALGCPYARCRFCAFYGASSYRPLTPSEFTDHLELVCALFGPGLAGRTGVFLGSANALALSPSRLSAVVAQTLRRFGPQRLSAFWDPDHSPNRDAAGYSELVAAGLGSVYVGLETGSPALRDELGKGRDLTEFVRRVRLASSSGLRIGVSVLAGVALDPREHEARTAEVIHALELRSEDAVFVSPLIGASHAREQAESLTLALKAATSARIAPYAPERHRYAS